MSSLNQNQQGYMRTYLRESIAKLRSEHASVIHARLGTNMQSVTFTIDADAEMPEFIMAFMRIHKELERMAHRGLDFIIKYK